MFWRGTRPYPGPTDAVATTQMKSGTADPDAQGSRPEFKKREAPIHSKESASVNEWIHVSAQGGICRESWDLQQNVTALTPGVVR